jgi:hypothetical protein
VIDSLTLQCAKRQDALARSSSSSSSEVERATAQSEEALHQLQQEHCAEVTRLQGELATLQQQLDQQVHLILAAQLYTLCNNFPESHVVASIVR